MLSLPFSGSFPSLSAPSLAGVIPSITPSLPSLAVGTPESLLGAAPVAGFAALLTAQQPAPPSEFAAPEETSAPTTAEDSSALTDAVLACLAPLVAPPPPPPPPPTSSNSFSPTGETSAADSMLAFTAPSAAALTTSNDGAVCTAPHASNVPASPVAPVVAAPVPVALATGESSPAAPAVAPAPAVPPEHLTTAREETAAIENHASATDEAPATPPAAPFPPTAVAAFPSVPRSLFSPGSPLSFSNRFSSAAKNSAAVEALPGRSQSVRPDTEINFLSPSPESLAMSDPGVGTSVAQSAPEVMSPRRSSAPATAPADASLDAIARVSAELFEATGSSLASAAETASAETTPVTPRAVVQQVLVALETAQTASEHAPANVKLDFDFGDAQVRVRLQIRDDTVHAHFETDSAELQHSLGQEWRATAAAEPARFARVAEPSFQTDFSPTNHGQHSTGGDRRESTPREPRPESAPYFGRAPASARASTAPVGPALSLTSSPLSQLHAFA